ncbi:MAG: hypothetical protein ACLSH6_10130 [Limosilactobacillus pontis]
MMNEQQVKRYRQAMELIRQEKWGAAAEVLNALAEETADPAVARQLVRALAADHQYVQALSNVLEAPDRFGNDVESAKLAVRLLVQNQRFMLARLFIADCSAEWQSDLMVIVVDGEHTAQIKYHQTIHQRLKDFYHLGDGSLMEQRQRLMEAYDLPLTSFLLGTRFVLRDPFAHYLIKADIIESLRRIEADVQLSYLWIDNQEYQVNPAKLVDQDELTAIKAVRQAITEQLGDTDAIRYQMANQQLDLQLMFLYPRAGQVITDPDKWARVLMATLDGQQLGDSTPTEKWQRCLMTQIATLTQNER